MRESKKIEKFVDKIQKKIAKQMWQIMKSINDLDGNDLNEYRKIAVGFKECLDKIFKHRFGDFDHDFKFIEVAFFIGDDLIVERNAFDVGKNVFDL